MNRQADRHGTLWVFQPGAVILRDLQIIGHLVELLTSHVERRIVVNFHGANVASATGLVNEE